MCYMMFTYNGCSRDLKKIITAILKSGFADSVKKINYVHDYLLKDDKVEKGEEKIILVHSENHDGFLDFLSKNFPQVEKMEIR